jgi:hypothetical protein
MLNIKKNLAKLPKNHPLEVHGYTMQKRDNEVKPGYRFCQRIGSYVKICRIHKCEHFKVCGG